MCCADLEPFNIVERRGFKKYVSLLKPDLEFPRGRTIATTALQDVFELYEKIVKDILSTAPINISLVLDLWTDNYKKLSYINIKIHYCQKFELIAASLKTEYFPHPHTGSRIADCVITTLKDFKLDNKIINAVNDGASNIVAGMRIGSINRYECMAHSLHRFLVHDILENPDFAVINNIVKKLKTNFKKLSYATEELTKIQRVYSEENIIDILLDTNEIVESLNMEEEFGITVTNEATTLKNSCET